MTPDTEPTDGAARPRAIPALAAVTMGLGFVGVQSALNQIDLVRAASLQAPTNLVTAIVHVRWRTIQDHRRLTAASEVSVLLTSLLLFVAASRVLFRARGGGWLWRHALAANVLTGLAAAAVDHSLRPGRVSVLRTILANEATRFPLPPGVQGGTTPLEFGALAFAVPVFGTLVTVALFAAAFAYATRERTRAWIDA